MPKITEAEFARISEGIYNDRELIIKNNPIGTREETLLWMLMSCLVSYLSLDDSQTPCFTGRPDRDTFREAIRYMLGNHSATNFEPEPYLDRLSGE